MAKGINKVILVGNLGNDPDVRYMPNGGAVANVSVATADSWMDKASGQRQERTEWHRVGIERYSTEIVASDMQMLGGRPGGGGGGSAEYQQGGGAPAQNRRPPQQQGGGGGYPQQNAAPAAMPPGPEADFDDDIPF